MCLVDGNEEEKYYKTLLAESDLSGITPPLEWPLCDDNELTEFTTTTRTVFSASSNRIRETTDQSLFNSLYERRKIVYLGRVDWELSRGRDRWSAPRHTQQ